MPLLVAADEKHITDAHEALLKRTVFEVGVVIGLPSSGRHTILRLVRSPDADEGKPPKAVGAVDGEWIVAHAQQVGHALPGGKAVLGLYVCCKTADLKTAEAKFASALRRIVGGGRLCGGGAILLHLPTDARRLACRAGGGESGAKLEVCELKLGKAAPALHRFDSLLAFDVSFAHAHDDGESSEKRATNLVQALALALRRPLEQLERAVALVDGKPVLDAEVQVGKLAAAAAPGAQPASIVAFFTRQPPCALAAASTPPPDSAHALRAHSYEVRCAGTIHARTYAQPKDALGATLEALKADGARSVERRLALLREELEDRLQADQDDEDEDEEGAGEDDDGRDEHTRRGAFHGKTGADVLPFARRAFFEVGGSGVGCAVDLCDLVLPTDDCEDWSERLELAIGGKVDAPRADGAEAFATAEAVLRAASVPAASSAKPSVPPHKAAASKRAGSSAIVQGSATSEPAQARSRVPMLAGLAVAVLVALAAIGLGLRGGSAPAVVPPHGKVINYPADAHGARQPTGSDSDEPSSV